MDNEYLAYVVLTIRMAIKHTFGIDPSVDEVTNVMKIMIDNHVLVALELPPQPTEATTVSGFSIN